MIKKISLLIIGVFTFLLIGCAKEQAPQETADTILHNGNVFSFAWGNRMEKAIPQVMRHM
jgi:hypothetical protein